MDNEKNAQEESWFLEKEQEQMRKLKEIREKEEAEEELKQLKDTHHMRCGKCGHELVEMDYKKGNEVVHIDKCGHCGSILLDAGELEKIISMNKGVLSKILNI